MSQIFLLDNYRVGIYNAQFILQYCLNSNLDTVNSILIFDKDFLNKEERRETVR